MSSTSFDARLRRLELQLSLNDSKAETETKDLESRLGALELRCHETIPSSLKDTWAEIDKLMEELDPGTALTHQRQIVAPILYRRQEILASADSFAADLRQLQQIFNLLLIGQQEIKPGDNTKLSLSERQITQAPILTAVDVSDEDQQRLDVLIATLAELQERTEKASDRLDRLLDHYHLLISTVSEKMVLADEQLRLREQS